MTHMADHSHETPREDSEDELERQLLEGISTSSQSTQKAESHASRTTNNSAHLHNSALTDVQGALGLFAEASQDMATAGVELGLGRHFACVDFCNQAVEKAAQAVSLLRYGRRSMYDHDLQALGALIAAPLEIQQEMGRLTPFHPEAFYADTPPEEADEVINAEQANGYMQSARKVLRWARSIVLNV